MKRWIWVIAFLTVTHTSGGGPAMGFELRSSVFAPSGTIPRKHTCDGPDLSPVLEWTNVPEGTKTLALICDDPDAPVGTWVHWVLYNLPAAVTSLPEGIPNSETTEQGASQGINDFRRIGYGGPCPPPGKPHRYFFKLYALDDKVPLSPGASKKELLKAMENHILGQAELMGTYAR
jgi:Raf kinase inhibitor-like YbhB/YbcL family protein